MQRINPPSLPAPRGYTHAVAATGRLVLLSGQTGEAAGGGLPDQFELALSRLLIALAAAGGQPSHLASATVYTTALAGYRASGKQLGEIWRRLAGPEYPAMAVVEVSRLWDPAALVEIQGMAVIP
jgi:enamine deaminase RidA (YjgF/YER057c/UK114 family)